MLNTGATSVIIKPSPYTWKITEHKKFCQSALKPEIQFHKFVQFQAQVYLPSKWDLKKKKKKEKKKNGKGSYIYRMDGK